MDAREVANRLTTWVEATAPRVAQQRYLARHEPDVYDQARLLAEAMELDLLCEEMQACARRYTTLRQLRGAVQQTVERMQRELARVPDALPGQDAADEIGGRMAGRAQAYRAAAPELAAIIGAGE